MASSLLNSDLVGDTFPLLLRANVAAHGTAPAMREKDLGIWQTYSWAESAAQIARFAAGLAELGFKRGDNFRFILGLGLLLLAGSTAETDRADEEDES